MIISDLLIPTKMRRTLLILPIFQKTEGFKSVEKHPSTLPNSPPNEAGAQFNTHLEATQYFNADIKKLSRIAST